MKLLQIDTCLGTGSTGRITESIARIAQNQGWECFIIHGARFVKRPSCMRDFQSVTKAGEYFHYFEGLLFDNHGLASRRKTRKVVDFIKEISPDIIQLHCIHGYFLNYKILFEYLNSTNIPVVWTFHDCWAFTGHCAHFVSEGCEKWKTGCYACPKIASYPKSLVDRSKRNFELKKRLFIANRHLHIVSVSYWLSGFVEASFFAGTDVRVIHNGVDISVFKPSAQRVNNEKVRILGVSGVWTKSKGIDDFYHLRDALDKGQYEIVLVGLSADQMRSLPRGIIGIEHTESVEELAALYASSDVFFNPTYADTFPTVNLEALACGTPVLTYRTGGSPEAVSADTGWVVEQGDIENAIRIIRAIKTENDSTISLRRIACRERAVGFFDNVKCFEQYLDLYSDIINS